MRAWHMWCGLGVAVTVACPVVLREHMQIKDDYLGVERTRDFLGVRAINGATVGSAAVGAPIRFDERWEAVSDTTLLDIPPVLPSRSLAPPPTPPPPEPAHVRAQAPPEPHNHHAAHREHHPAHLELCAAHGMRREYYRRNGWLSWRCKK